MNRSRLQIAKQDILRHFDQLPARILSLKDISRHLNEQRDNWRLAQSASTTAFIEFLQNSGKLNVIKFPFPSPYKQVTRYVWSDASLYEVILSIKPKGYFSHYTAMKFHGLTEQLPKTLYLNHEQFSSGVSVGKMTQGGIDTAFLRRPRATAYIAETKDFRLCILNGRNTGNLGVIEDDIVGEDGKPLGKLRLTNVERTLIDIAVRPVYAGGVFEVAKAYGLAQGRVSVNTLSAMLKKLDYAYPYHQTIGFYLERAGYKPALLDLFRSVPFKFDFYLAHNMGKTDYVKSWRLHVPKGF
ncbi:MAG: hypothetical protein WD042_16855 [Phycisphaeraceae bacterium]